jgi:hypothetical protein
MSFKEKSLIIWIEGITPEGVNEDGSAFSSLEKDHGSIFGESLDHFVKEGGIQFLLQRQEYSLFQTITRLTHIIENKDKPEPKCYMIRNFFSSSSQSFSDMFNVDMMLWTNNQDIISSDCEELNIVDCHHVTTNTDILELFESFATVHKLFYIHIDLSKPNDFKVQDLVSLLFQVHKKKDSLSIDWMNINIILSPILEWEEKDFHPPVEEESIVAAIIPKQTFTTYMNKPISVDYSKCSLLIQYDLGVTRKFGEFETLQDVLDFTQQRYSNYGILKSKTILGDNLMTEIAFKLGTIGKFGA